MTVNATPLFIVGLPRSGTKLLRALIDNHPAVFVSPYETECLPWLVRHTPAEGWQGDAGFLQLWSMMQSLPLFEYLQRDGIAITAQAWQSHCASRDAAGVFDGLMRAVAESLGQTGWQCWGDKSPSHIGHVELIAHCFPGARIIHIVRDVRDVAASSRKAWGKHPVRTAQRWRDDVLNVHAVAAREDIHLLEMRFEDLLAEPERCVKAIMAFLDLPFMPSQLQLPAGLEDLGSTQGADRIMPQATGNYQQVLSAREVEAVERVACDAMQVYGYACRTWQGPRQALSAGAMRALRCVDAVQLVRHRMRTQGLLGAIAFYWRYSRFSGNGIRPAPVLMLGTDFSSRGGIASVASLYRDSGFLAREQVRYIATHNNGSALKKLGYALRAYLLLWCSLLTGRYRLVHVHLSSRNSFWRKRQLISVVRLFRVPYVLHLHGSEFREFYNESTAREQCAIRQTFDRAAAVIVLSKSWQRWVTGISTNPRIEVVPNAVPVPDQASVRPAHHLLFMGRLGERKGINTLLDAVAVLTREFPDLRVVCAGDGDLAAVRERIQVLGLQSCVTVPGWMGPAERTHLLQDASIFVLPSHNEGLPMAILEAMAAGLAVISTPVGGIPDAVIDNETGALVKPGDVNALAAALRRVLTDHALTERWGDAGRARVQQCFSPAASEARIRAVWEQVAP